MKNNRELAQEMLTPAGIVLNGPNPWDPQIHDERMFDRLFSDGLIAVGESYMDGWWDADDIPDMVTRFVRANQIRQLQRTSLIPLLYGIARHRLLNLQVGRGSWKVGEQHYDIGNDIYERMLDKRLTYSCGYWKDARTLDEAQEAKLDLICRKLGLKKGDRVLDIGCGWGSFAIFAAERYGASVVGVTISKEQAALARERAGSLPVEIRLQDYREVSDGPYDHIVSIGMFEHVGHKNYKTFMRITRRLLKEDGLMLLHTIGQNGTTGYTDPWMEKYIFPNSILPSAAQVTAAADHVFDVIEDWHNFGADYDKTLFAWRENFNAAWPEIKDKYGERFYRMWQYYLLSMMGNFRSRQAQLWQIVFSPKGVSGGYESVR